MAKSSFVFMEYIMHKKVPMTPDGYKKMQEQLKHLKANVRPMIVRAIEEARDHGDLSENAEYDMAKEDQQQVSKQIEKLEHKLSLAQVIDPKTLEHDKVAFGATVKLHDLDSDEILTYQIVGVDEADAANRKISIESPMGRAMIGKEVGDEISVKTPKGNRTLELLDVVYQ